MTRKPNIYSIYDSYDNDTLVYSGDSSSAASFLKIRKTSVSNRIKVPYDQQKARYKVILDSDDDCDDDAEEKEIVPSYSETDKLKIEIERLNEEIGILRTCYLNELTSDKTTDEIKKYIMQLRLYEARELKHWMDNIMGEER